MAKDLGAELAAIIGANDEATEVKSWLDSGFAPLNFASSSKYDGSFPVGRMIEIAGPSSSGKTAIATQAMIAAQKAGGMCGFNDHERSFSETLGVRLGLNNKPGYFVFKKPRTFEQSLQICVHAATAVREKKLIPKEAPICWVFDSLASMVPQSALLDAKTGEDRGFESRNMNDNTALPRATGAHFPAFAQHMEELDVCAIFLNQMRSKIGVLHGDPRKTTGGNAAEHYFSQRLWLSASQIKKGTDIIGSEVTGTFKKNKVARPFRQATWRFMFREDGSGFFDVERSLVDFLIKQKALDMSGNYVVWDGNKYFPEVFARKVEKEGLMPALKALLPANYEPTIEIADENEAA